MTTATAPDPARRREWLIAAAVLIATLVVYGLRYLPYLSNAQKTIGSDYSYFLPHLLAGDFWFGNNGPFAVPWMTPAFCGGIPLYPNPQSFYYSPAQWLSFVVSPLHAVDLTILLYAACGGAGMYVLIRRRFGGSLSGALLGAIIYIFNGFYSHRMLIGHFAFAPFMLTPLVAAIVLSARSEDSWMTNGLVTGLIFTLMFQSGMVVLFGPMMLALVWFGVLHTLRSGKSWQWLWALAVGGVVAIPLCASKLVAASALLSQFGRDYYTMPGIPAVDDLLLTVLRMLFWHATPEIASHFRNSMIVMQLHEWEYSLSPVPLLVIAAGTLLWLSRRRWTRPESVTVARLAPGLLLVLVFLVPLALNYYSTSWNAILRAVPLLSSSPLLSRWLAFYIPVAAFLAARAFDQLPVRPVLWVVAVVGCIVFHTGEDADPPGDDEISHIPQHLYAPADVEEAWQRWHSSGKVPPVQAMTRLMHGNVPMMVNGENAVARAASNLFCYEPMFGYDLAKLPSGVLHDGLALDVSGDHFNVFNPACFLYPGENYCKPGDRISTMRREEAVAFLGYQPISWKAPPAQTLANGINLAALVVVPGLLAALLWKERRDRSAGASNS